MFTPMTPVTERTRIRTEREYREWQRALQGNVPVKRFRNGPGILSRVANIIRRVLARRLYPVAEPRRMERHISTSG